MVTPLEKEFEYYLANQEKFVQEYRGKYLVIKGEALIGVYDSELEAILKTSQEHEVGTFLVQRCEPGEESYTQSYHSRVMFA